MIPTEWLSQIRTVQEAIVERLEPLKEMGVYLRFQPATGEPQPRGMLQIFYIGSKYTEPTRGEMRQERELQFLLAIYLRDLREQAEIYSIEQAILWLLTGWKPLECEYPGMVYPIESQIRPERNEAGYWITDLIYGIRIQHEAQTYG